MAGHVADREAYGTSARSLAARILSAQEAERLRVSRELHDETGQALTLILVRLQIIEGLTDQPDVLRELQDLRQVVVETLDGVRKLAVQLRPSVLDELGLRAALQWLGERVREETELRVDLDLRCDDEGISTPVAVAVFRVAQEAMTNVVRHARASQITLRLERSRGRLRMVLRDDGRGFDVADARSRPTESIGLFGMAERVALVGGRLDITSAPGAGTVVELTVKIGEAK